MRLLPAFLFALGVLAALAFGISASQRPSNIPNPRPIPNAPELWGGYTAARMWRRAEIRVVPLDHVDLDKAELQSLRDRVARAQSQRTADPHLRTQISEEQVQLINDLLKFAEQQQAHKAKTPTALEVERRLNQIQGETMCEACHNGIVAQNATLK